MYHPMMIHTSLVDLITGPCLGWLAVSQVNSPSDWKDVTTIGILGILVVQLVRQVIESRNKPNLLKFEERTVIHDRVCAEAAEKTEELFAMHKDPHSGFSTLFLDNKIDTLIELQRESILLQRKLLDFVKSHPRKDNGP